MHRVDRTMINSRITADSPGRSAWQTTNSVPAIVAQLILLLTPFLIVVDTMNGALMRGIGISGLSQAFKVAYLLLLFIYSARTRSGLLTICACLLSNIIFVAIHIIPNGTLEALTSDVQWLLRFNIVWLGYHVFKQLLDRGRIGLSWIYKCIAFVSAVLFINLMLGTLGFGYSQYGKYSDSEQIGAVGFIYAGNEMSFLLLLCQVVLCGITYHSQNRSSMVKYLLICAVFFVASVLKATKAAMLGSLIISFAFPAIEFARGLLTFKMSSLKALAIGVFSAIIAIAAAPFAISLIERTGLLARMEYFFDEFGLLFVIFSGRDQFARDFLDNVWADYTIVESLFGPGRHEMLVRLGHPVEIDVLDILGGFGITGLVIYYLPYLALFFKSTTALLRKSPALSTGLVFSTILLAVSVTAGHVIYSGLAAPYMALCMGFFAWWRTPDFNAAAR